MSHLTERVTFLTRLNVERVTQEVYYYRLPLNTAENRKENADQGL